MAGGVLSVCKETHVKVKGKVFPYSLASVGPGADPGVQTVSPQVTWRESRHRPGSRLPLLSARPAVISVRAYSKEFFEVHNFKSSCRPMM